MSVYCVVCEESHASPVAVATNDRCPLAEREREMLKQLERNWRGGGIMGRRP